MKRLFCWMSMAAALSSPVFAASQPEITTRAAKVLSVEGLRFRDLNRDGALNPYEDWRLPAAARAKDLLARMTLEEKAGAMMHGTARAPNMPAGMGAQYDLAENSKLIENGVTSLITRLSADAGALAEESNKLQELAERARLGIPLTVSTDPRNHFEHVAGASVAAKSFSQWPESLGFAAIGDANLTRSFADIARQEYRAVGIHMALSPQADLATEPRWPRIAGTFGEDAELAGRMVAAYVEGFQHGQNGLDASSVATVVKHWVGYGAAKNGFDSHNYYGRFASFPSGSIDYHVKPFLNAFRANVSAVMPTYSILEGTAFEPVGAGFNRGLLTDLLRNRYGFNGLIISDWGIGNDCNDICRKGFPKGERPSFRNLSMAWGTESLTKLDRYVKGVQAGLDQFGGSEEPEVLVQAVKSGKLTESRLDESVQRILTQKFELGLFESPFVDAARAKAIVGSASFRAQAHAAQRRALVLLKNQNNLLPLSGSGIKVFLHGIDPEIARQQGLTPVQDVKQANVAIIRAEAPFQTLHPNFMFGSFQHEGDLDFKDGNAEYEVIKRASRAVPTIVTVYLDRPAILTNIVPKTAALLVNFGVDDSALLEVITGRGRAEGKLPFELPSSMADVKLQASDLPHDTRKPLFKIFDGVATAAKPVGEFEDHADVGNPKLTGAATYNAASQDYVFTSAGTNMWAARDEFHFAWRRMPGDFILQARVEFVGKGVDPHRKAGWIVRKTLAADSPYVDTAIHGDGLTSLQYRRLPGALTEQTESAIKGADVIQLERRGNRYIFSAARAGEPYTTSEISDIDVGAEPYFGLFLTSHNPDVIEQVVFRNVRIIRPAKPDFVPYKDYIGSQLELLDVQTGKREIIHRSKIPFEAPNWTPDGAALIFNTSGGDPNTRGRIYRFDLSTRKPMIIDTDFANRSNNDHVLSFDGSMLGISDQSTDAGQSTIFTLPVGGGTPKRITPLTPSYLHGWSPDRKWLVFTGGRNNEYDIYKIASDGSGKEIRLTEAKALDDGPEFTPDGKWIYFNSTRSGKMQIFRMKPDGSDQQQLTNDAHNNWFPHISPDGKQLVMISYVDEISPTEHPYYKRVYLRLMPIEGGEPKVIAYVYGGQGTINVPSWSPDGRMLAFVSNSDF